MRCRISGYDEPSDTISVAIIEGARSGQTVQVTGTECYEAFNDGVALDTELRTVIADAVQEIHDRDNPGDSPVTNVGTEFSTSLD